MMPRMATRLLTQTLDSPVGPLLAVVVERDGAEALCMLEFHDRPRLPREIPELERAFGCEPVPARAPLHDEVERQLAAYFAGASTTFTLPLEAPGTAFQRRVWQSLLEIPFGTTTTYGKLAEGLGAPGAQRAVGAANGANRVAIVIPCHRVIESGGGLRGYGGGLERKRWLLTHEGAWPAEPGLFSRPPEAARPPARTHP